MERIKRFVVFFILLLFPVIVYAGTELGTTTQYPIVGSTIFIQLDISYCLDSAADCSLPKYMIRDFHTVIDYDPSSLRFEGVYWSQSSGSYSIGEEGTIYIDKEAGKDWKNGPALQLKFTVLKSGMTEVGIRRNGDSHYADGNVIGQSLAGIHIGAKEPSTEVYLSGLYISGYDIQPTFSYTQSEYTLSVPSDVSKIVVVSNKGDSRQTITGDGLYYLSYGENKIHVVVQAQDGSTFTYNINVVRKDDRSGDTTLVNINVGGDIIPIKENVYDYETVVKRSSDTIILNARATDPYATLIGTGKKTLNIGENKFVLTVESSNGKSRDYTIVINRSTEEFEIIEESKKLKSIKVNNVSLDLSNDITKWFYGINSSDNELNISTVTESKTAEVEIIGNENLKAGINVVTVKVTEMKNVTDDGPTENDYTIYTIIVYKSPLDTLLISSLEEIPNDSDVFYRTSDEDNSVIKKQVFETLKDSGKKLYYNVVNNYNGLLYQATILGNVSDDDLDVSFKFKDNHFETKLPKGVEIYLNVSEMFDDEVNVKIYTYTGDGEYNLLTDGLTVQNGYIRFVTNGDTDYVITNVSLINEDGPFKKLINKYKNIIIGVIIGIVLIIIIVVIIVKIRKKNNPNELLY